MVKKIGCCFRKVTNCIYAALATDRNIQQNLGATINNVSKSLPLEFTAKLKKSFRDGYDIIFIGYSGLDFFDVRPFFEGLAYAAST